MTDKKPKELLLGDGLPPEMLVEIDSEHSLPDTEPLLTMVEMCVRLENKTQDGSNR